MAGMTAGPSAASSQLLDSATKATVAAASGADKLHNVAADSAALRLLCAHNSHCDVWQLAHASAITPAGRSLTHIVARVIGHTCDRFFAYWFSNAPKTTISCVSHSRGSVYVSGIQAQCKNT